MYIPSCHSGSLVKVEIDIFTCRQNVAETFFSFLAWYAYWKNCSLCRNVVFLDSFFTWMKKMHYINQSTQNLPWTEFGRARTADSVSGCMELGLFQYNDLIFMIYLYFILLQFMVCMDHGNFLTTLHEGIFQLYMHLYLWPQQPLKPILPTKVACSEILVVQLNYAV